MLLLDDDVMSVVGRALHLLHFSFVSGIFASSYIWPFALGKVAIARIVSESSLQLISTSNSSTNIHYYQVFCYAGCSTRRVGLCSAKSG